jgi:hypothetical protein
MFLLTHVVSFIPGASLRQHVPVLKCCSPSFLQWMQEDDELSENGNDLLDPDAPRQQKHAKSPELARDFLLDAATVIFKEQVGNCLNPDS